MLDSITLYVTTDCQLGCPLCTARALAERTGSYHMSLEEVDELIGVCRASGYHFDQVKLSVREPLLWKNLAPGCRMLADSGVCDHIMVFTNAWAFTPEREAEIVEALKPVDRLRASRYHGNEDRVAAFVARFPNTEITEVPVHNWQPHTPVPGTLPARCICRGLGLFQSVVTVCPGIHNLYATLGRNPLLYPKCCVPLTVGCVETLESGTRRLQDHCQYCLGNELVMRAMPSEPTRVPAVRDDPETV